MGVERKHISYRSTSSMPRRRLQTLVLFFYNSLFLSPLHIKTKQKSVALFAYWGFEPPTTISHHIKTFVSACSSVFLHFFRWTLNPPGLRNLSVSRAFTSCKLFSTRTSDS